MRQTVSQVATRLNGYFPVPGWQDKYLGMQTEGVLLDQKPKMEILRGGAR